MKLAHWISSPLRAFSTSVAYPAHKIEYLEVVMQKMVLNVNGVNRFVIVDPESSLADVLRQQLLSDRHEGLLQ